MARRLYLSTMPVVDFDGKVRRFTVARPDGKHLTRDDINAIRMAFGQDPLTTEELDAYHRWVDR